MIPLHDANPARRFPLVTIVLLLVNVGVYFLVQPAAGEVEQVQVDGRSGQIDGQLAFNLEQAAIPCEVVEGRPLGIEEVEGTFARGTAPPATTTAAGPPCSRRRTCSSP